MSETLIQQGLSQVLERLEQMRLDYIGDPSPPLLCSKCYSEADECWCLWPPELLPLPAVVYKLRAELRSSAERDGDDGRD